jgi:GTP-binding protein
MEGVAVGKRVTVAIVGRPNVGKSTLFNRILHRREAVVHDEPGVTRDRHYGATTWNGRAFYVVDTGGLLPRARDGMPALVRDSALVAVQEADVLLFVADAATGVTDVDAEVARVLQKSGKPVVVAVNKTEETSRALQASEFYELGLGEPYPVSALHGHGTGDLLDRIVELLPPTGPEAPESDAELRVAIVGKPNVGKSSLLNALAGEERALVSDQPGTTRDAIDTRLRWHGHTIDLIDTAGLRRQARLKDSVDVFAALRTMRSIERADVCLLLLDATEPISNQDTRIGGFVHKAGKGLVICFNKWDAVEKDGKTADAFKRTYEREFAFASYAPVLFISATEGTRLHRPLEAAWEVGEARQRRIATAELNRTLQAAVQRRPPHFHAGGTGSVKYASQVDVEPPRFAIFVNNPLWFDRSYIRYLSNALRAEYTFPGSVLKLELRPSPGGRRGGAEAS